MPAPAKTLVHETTYRKKNPVGWVHRNRLRAVTRVFERHVPASATSWLDAGCSNGFIIAEMLARHPARFTRIVGLDHAADLVDQARARNIPAARFDMFDLNAVEPAGERFDVVTCLETLEHVGHLPNAIANLVDRVNDGGVLLVSIPNETGLPGLMKLAGRAAVRRNPYDDFFARGGRARYVAALLLNRRIDAFRAPGRAAWGPHLGFDYRSMQDHLRAAYVQRGVLQPRAREITTLGMNVLMVYEKRGAGVR